MYVHVYMYIISLYLDKMVLSSLSPQPPTSPWRISVPLGKKVDFTGGAKRMNFDQIREDKRTLIERTICPNLK